MNLKKTIIAILLPLAIIGLYRPSYGKYGDDDVIVLSFFSGNDYLEMSKEIQEAWLYGVMDGIMAESEHAYAFTPEGNSEGDSVWLGRCIHRKNLPMSQIKAIFEKRLKSKPEEWQAPAAFIFLGRFRDFCGEQPRLGPNRKNKKPQP